MGGTPEVVAGLHHQLRPQEAIIPRERKPKKYHGGRGLLNPYPGQQTTAAIVAEVQDMSGKEYEPKPDSGYVIAPETVLQIANCDRSIAFEFNFWDAETRANNIEKIDTMLDALKKFRRGLVTETKRYEDRQARCKALDD